MTPQLNTLIKVIADLQAENERMKDFLAEYKLIGEYGELVAPKPTVPAPPEPSKYGLAN